MLLFNRASPDSLPNVTTSTSAAELVKRLTSQAECASSLLILCPDEIRKHRILDIFFAAFLPQNTPANNSTILHGASSPSLALSRLDAGNLDAAAIKSLADDVSCLSLFAQRRFFVIYSIESLRTECVNALLELCMRLPADCKFILSGSKLAAASSIKKFFAGRSALIELDALQGQELRRWTAKELRRLGLNRISQAALDALVEIGEESPDKISKLAEHLSLFCDGGQAGLQDLERVFHYQTVQSDFAFLDSINQGKISRAEALLNDLFASGKSPFMLLALLAKTFSNYLSIKSALQRGVPAAEIRQSLNAAPWVFNKHLQAVKNYSLQQLKRSIHAILRADSKLKHRSLGAEAIFSELFHSILGEVKATT